MTTLFFFVYFWCLGIVPRLSTSAPIFFFSVNKMVVIPANSRVGPPPSLAEQLKQVLAERERRMLSGEPLRDSTDSLDKDPAGALVEEVRQAVNESNARSE